MAIKVPSVKTRLQGAVAYDESEMLNNETLPEQEESIEAR
jgi:hypothetical protein